MPPGRRVHPIALAVPTAVAALAVTLLPALVGSTSWTRLRVPAASAPAATVATSAPTAAIAASAPMATFAAPAAGGRSRGTPGHVAPQAPEVKIVTPLADRPLADPVVLQALVRARGPAPVVEVRAFADDVELEVLTGPPYRWTVPRPDGGTLHLRVVARDAAGASGQAEILVTASPGVRFDADVRAVALGLTALDAEGRFVHDLERDEIRVLDDGEPQTILEFARAEAPLRVVVLLDRSRSMADRMPATREALGRFLDLLAPGDQVKLIAFSDRVTSYTPFTDVHDLVAAFSRGIDAGGGTALYDALVYGQRQLAPFAGARERRVILLLTDGEDSTSRTGLGPAVDRLRADSVTVFALGQGDALESGELRDVLAEITGSTGGDTVLVDEDIVLSQVLADLAAAMRALYFVSFVPSRPEAGWHELSVEVERPGLRLRHRPGYERRPGGGGPP